MPPASDHPLQRIGRYTVLDRLGSGSMGVVYKGYDEMLDRYVAVKMMAADMTSSAELRKRFAQEARLAAKLSHPNIITVYDLGETNGQSYIAMELLEGQDLKAYIREGTAKPMRKLVEWMVQLCDAVSFAHREGIIHRDIKPANVHIREDQTLVLMDFGIARAASSRISGAGAIIGTPEYISPEQVLALNIDHRADIFSLGLVYYEILTLHHPFRSTTLAATIHLILNEKPEHPHKLNRHVTKRLGDIVMKCMEKDVNQRYQSCVDLLADLNKLTV